MSVPRRFLTSDKGTFGAFTAEERWPIICQNAVDDIKTEVEELKKAGATQEVISEGLVLEKELAELREEILKNTELRAFTEEEIKIANVPGSFNEYLKESSAINRSWANAEWLFAEVYLYRRINVLFMSKKAEYWQKFDIFDRLKQATFKSSLYGVVELAHRYKNLREQLKTLDVNKESDLEILQILFKEFIEVSLWGNATDLSLLTNITLEDIKSIQGAKAREESEAKIVVNDTDKAWESLLNSTKQSKRVDFVLDNSGFELYADLMLAAFLIESKLASKCIFHAKDMPYMVSDVMLKDYDALVKDLEDREFFPVAVGSEDDSSLNLFASELSNFVKNGSLELRTDSFWTTHLDYWAIDPSETKYHGAEIHKDLMNSDLVIFKGDLNYRKLAGDRQWPRTTDWDVAIGPLAHNGVVSLSLRTCKADVQVALPDGLDEKLCKEWEKDHPGQGSWWCSSGKWAVICFSSGN
ncbi:hypothetical protein RNJ44_03784 [Nakaseomyces bracarensis]|uniref:Sugar phosphate phosphatase n=1 Tax=Nakaseomyces bracarensis TaxID=273131 RepID=A0ABR4NY04_9SACH